MRFQTSEQHVDFRKFRVTRDNSDVVKIDLWLASHPPFVTGNSITSISSGIVGDDTINCHNAEEVGFQLMSSMFNSSKTFGSVSCSSKERVKSLTATNKVITKRVLKSTMNPFILFQRMCFSNPTEADLKKYFTYELAPFPMALFSEEGMRKNAKSDLYKAFSPILSEDIFRGHSCVEVVDGDFLLHKVPWDKSANFDEISSNYVKFVEHHFRGSQTVVVFDGYQDDCQHADRTDIR